MDTVPRPDAVILLLTAEAEGILAVPPSRARSFTAPPPIPIFLRREPIPVAFRPAASARAS